MKHSYAPGLTLLACSAWLAAFLAASHLLTSGFSAWTFEDQRREQARALALAAPATELQAASGETLLAFSPGQAPADTIYLVDFIYTRCDTVCRVLGVEFHQLQEQLRKSGARVQLLSISVDPQRDDPAALQAYAQLHRADASRWTLARPTSAPALEQLRRQLGVIVIPDGLGGFVHNGAIHLVDGQQRVRAIYDHADWISALAHAESLAGTGWP